MEFTMCVICVIILYILSHLTEWISDSRMSEIDWLEASEDIRKYDKSYFHKQNAKGKYDKKD